jgi:hypothetical protein
MFYKFLHYNQSDDGTSSTLLKCWRLVRTRTLRLTRRTSPERIYVPMLHQKNSNVGPHPDRSSFSGMERTVSVSVDPSCWTPAVCVHPWTFITIRHTQLDMVTIDVIHSSRQARSYIIHVFCNLSDWFVMRVV